MLVNEAANDMLGWDGTGDFVGELGFEVAGLGTLLTVNLGKRIANKPNIRPNI